MSKIDPITAEIIRNGMIEIAHEMTVTLGRAAYTPIFSEGMDYSCAVFTSDARLISQAEGAPIHVGAMSFAVEAALKEIGIPSIDDGDVIMVNDPYMGGSHLNDISVITPLFHHSDLVSFLVSRGHHGDLGGTSPGSICSDATEICQEGIRFPPLKLYRKGELQSDLLKFAMANVRTPFDFRGDLMAQVAANHTGQNRVNELFARYGLETVMAGWEDTLNYSERRARGGLAKVPDGEYEFEDYVDDDGIQNKPVKIKVKLTKKGSDVIVDFTGSAGPAKGPVNCPFGVTASLTYAAFMGFLDPTIPVNHGFRRPIKIIAPEGTIVNAKYPSPVFEGTIETAQRIADVVLGALGKAMPKRAMGQVFGAGNQVLGGGYDHRPGLRHGIPYVFYIPVLGGWGATAWRDGTVVTPMLIGNVRDYSAEMLELRYPLLNETYQLRIDSGGPGKYRGGLGAIRSFRLYGNDAVVNVASDRFKIAPSGVIGGLPALPGEFTIARRNGGKTNLPSKKSGLPFRDGEVWELKSQGGGGYGNPMERDPKLVLNDVAEGYVSIKAAKKHYKVAVRKTGSRFQIDALATRKLRRRK